jgi:choline monooxygenase
MIDPELRRAATPPGAWYGDPEAFRRIVAGAFAPAWHYVGPASQVANPGDVAPVVLGPGTLDEPLLLTRDEAGEVRALSNACTHRGMVMYEAPCQTRNLRCRYHGRRFGLDGRLKAAPGFEGAEDFPRPEDDLQAAQLGRLGPLLFASLGGGPSIEDWLAPVRARMGFFPLEALVEAPERARDFEVAASFIAYLDNYLEGMHIPYIHPGLAAVLDGQDYRYEIYEQGNLQIGLGGDSVFELPEGHPEHGHPVAAYYFHLFPNVLLNFYPWGLSLNTVEPRAPDRCAVRFRAFVARPELLTVGAGADLVQVELEDEAAVEAVARGIRARLYRGGRYAPQHEGLVHHFHRHLAAAMAR